MDTQPTPANGPGAPEGQPGKGTEFTPGVAASPETTGNAAPSGQPAQPAATNPAPHLSTSDVVAAITAMPTPVATPGSGNPATAKDEDVIEPEWVEKAEEVVKKHEGDPYGEEEAIEDLQIDYLQKRYGVSVAKPGDEKEDKPKGA